MARIIVNPTTFRNEKDALCVAYNEAFRIVMEETGFDPVSEPTEAQRKFFSDTAYADDETMLRRTIIARICTFDTSVKDPTDEQIQEAVEFLESVMEAGYPKNEEEQTMVKRIHDVLSQVPVKGTMPERSVVPDEEPVAEEPDVQAVELGGQAEDEERRDLGGKDRPDNPETDVKGAPVEKADVPPVDETLKKEAEALAPSDPTKDAVGPMLNREDEQ